jgi:hypothetical protein
MIFERGHFKKNEFQKALIDNMLFETKLFSITNKLKTNQTTIFLSHKHKDLKELEEASYFIQFLEEKGAKVYIDTLDNTLPDETTGETAIRIKKIIEECDRFIFLATNNAIDSTWCNWELGIGDVYKYKSKIALIPIKDKGQMDSQYKGNEYLQIYPYIEYYNGTEKYNLGHFVERGYYVRQPPNSNGKFTIEKLETWLKK